MDIIFRKAQRRAVPMLISISSVSGGGKTYSALLLAAGIAGPTGRVGMIDTENGRGEMYTDSPGIRKALPNGFEYSRIDPPYSPEHYLAYIDAAERAGITVCVIDSATHEWEGIGGCCEIAEKNKMRGMPNWAKAKMEHKKFMNRLLSSPMHLIFCVRARDKVKIQEINGKSEVIPIGLTPVCEKNFIFEMTVSLQLEEKTHLASPLKVPEPLAQFFPSGKLITMEDGARLREWCNAAPQQDAGEQLNKQARAAADEGLEAYKRFFTGLKPAQQKLITDHEGNKRRAQESDAERSGVDLEEFASLRDTLGDAAYFRVLGTNGVEKIDMASAAEREKILDQLRGLVAA